MEDFCELKIASDRPFAGVPPDVPLLLNPSIFSHYCREEFNIETGKTWGPVDGRGHAMFGWPMEEEAKLEFTITVNWRREDGSIATTQLGTLDRGACRSAEDVGLQLADAKPIQGTREIHVVFR